MQTTHRTRFRPLIAALGAALLLPAAALAQEPAAPAKPAAAKATTIDPTPHLGVSWYGVYMQGQKVGYGRMSLEAEERDGAQVIVSASKMLFRVAAAGNQIEMKIHERTVYSREGAQHVIEKSRVQEQAGQKVETTARRDGDEFVVVRTMAGQAMPEQRVKPPTGTLRTAFAVELLVASKPKVGDVASMPSFNLDRLAESTDTATVKAITEGFSGGVATKIYSIEMKDGRTGDTMTAKAGSDGKFLEIDVAGGFVTLRLEPEKLAKDIQYSGDLFVGGLAKPDKPLGDPNTVQLLKVEMTGTGDVEVASNGRQTVTKGAEGALVVTIKMAPDPTTLDTVTEKDAADARKATADFPSTHPEVVALAKQAVGDAATDAEKMKRLVSFVDKYVEDEMSLSAINALDVLRSKKGDCSEHTSLFVALSRASGLAARPVSGLMYGGDALGAFGWHAWAEVALDGRWIAVDPTWNQQRVDATHIRLGIDDQASAMMKLYGKVKLKVLELKRKE